jgi:hypothetical protein
MQTEKVWTLDDVRADWARVKCEVAYVRTIVAAHQLMKIMRRQETFNPYHDDAGRFTTADEVARGGQNSLGGGFDTVGVGGNAKQPSSGETQVANSERRPGGIGPLGTRVPDGPSGGGGGFGSAGKQVVTPQGRGLTTRGEKRALERNFTLERVDAIIDNNRANRVGVVDSQGKKTWEYTDARGNKVVTNEAGGIVSVHSPATDGVYIEKP